MPGLEIEAELNILTLSQDSPTLKEQPQLKNAGRRDTELDPLVLAAAFASVPHITRHHHSHDFFPAVGDPRAEGVWDWTKWTGQDAPSVRYDPQRRSYDSHQGPRKQRLRALGLPVDPEPQVEVATSPPELESPSVQIKTGSSKPSTGHETVTNERAFMYIPSSVVLALNDPLLIFRARVTPFG